MVKPIAKPARHFDRLTSQPAVPCKSGWWRRAVPLQNPPMTIQRYQEASRRNWCHAIIKPDGLIAKFHYTDPTRTRHGPDTDKVRARCRVRAKFHYKDPTGPARTQRSFAAKKVRAGPVGSV